MSLKLHRVSIKGASHELALCRGVGSVHRIDNDSARPSGTHHSVWQGLAISVTDDSQFDDLPYGTVIGEYNGNQYQGLVVAGAAPVQGPFPSVPIDVPHLQAYTAPRYAEIASDSDGHIEGSFFSDDYTGVLYSFRFGCGTSTGTSFDGFPLDCNIGVTTACGQQYGDPLSRRYLFQYSADPNGMMQLAQLSYGFPAERYPSTCRGYTFRVLDQDDQPTSVPGMSLYVDHLNYTDGFTYYSGP
ncbi:hypothetical protein MRB53_040601 [Persea americana]|nr:hypothetical protein MRB53_040601 [Persea americana]